MSTNDQVTYLCVTDDILLVSRQTIPTTQRMTTRPLPGVSTSPNPTTVRVFQPATHVQLTIDMNYDDIEDTVAIGNEVMVGLYEIMGVSRDRLSNSHVLRGTSHYIEYILCM